ncbi:hypothetical protein MST27_04930 [Pseudomonas sp. PS1]|uniref:Uncharacterized protein n=1 Tax=Stutzerimonas marianensis TaxID=2929513 RepID=A0A9X2ARP1_9GAMM|nr:hypothetical protein [Pseudomonas marianensis]MCJ0972710.1 hypothetical protein [Pseudomonas marianensis]
MLNRDQSWVKEGGAFNWSGCVEISGSLAANPESDDNVRRQPHTHAMTNLTRDEMNQTLSAIEERMDKRIERMERDAERRTVDYKHELSLRDDQLRRELDMRQESFRAEQAARDAALAEKFSGFLAAQAERDKAWEKVTDARFERIERDVNSIKTDAKTITADVHGLKITMAKYLGGAVVIGALASAALGVALRHFFS